MESDAGALRGRGVSADARTVFTFARAARRGPAKLRYRSGFRGESAIQRRSRVSLISRTLGASTYEDVDLKEYQIGEGGENSRVPPVFTSCARMRVREIARVRGTLGTRNKKKYVLINIVTLSDKNLNRFAR